MTRFIGRFAITICLALAWLFANPQLRLLSPESGWLETGASHAVAKTRHTTRKVTRSKARKAGSRKSVRKTSTRNISRGTPAAADTFNIMVPERGRRGSSALVEPIPLPKPTRFPRARVIPPAVNSAVTPALPVPGYESVPRVQPLPQVDGETFSDRVSRCVHQGGMGGLNSGQIGGYVGSCAQ
jgi:hypothetical protein